MIYDNRARSPLPGFSPGMHFSFRVGGKLILYCYIRKNACSAFKRLIVARSPKREKLDEFSSPLRFLQRFHRVRDIRPEVYDHAIFVYRDPVERLVSIYRNKFVQLDGNRGIFANYASITGRAPEQASFTEFLYLYLNHLLPDLDAHLHPQAASLAPILYSDAISLPELHRHMVTIIGQKPADRRFLHPINSSAAPAWNTSEDIRAMPARALHHVWKQTGAMPPVATFLGPGDADHIRGLYAADCQMLDALHSATPATHIA